MRSEIVQELLKTALNFQSRLEDLLDHQIHKVENRPADTEPAADSLKTLAKLGQIYRAQVSVCTRLAREYEKAAPKVQAEEDQQEAWPVSPDAAPDAASEGAVQNSGSAAVAPPSVAAKQRVAPTEIGITTPAPALRMSSMPIPEGVRAGQWPSDLAAVS